MIEEDYKLHNVGAPFPDTRYLSVKHSLFPPPQSEAEKEEIRRYREKIDARWEIIQANPKLGAAELKGIFKMSDAKLDAQYKK